MTASSPAAALAPARAPERRAVLQLALGVLLYAICQAALAAGAVAVFAASGAGGEATIGDILAMPGPAAGGFVLGAVIAIVGFVLIVRLASGRRVIELSGAGAPREIGWGLLVGAGVVALGVAVLALLGVYRVEQVGVGAGILTGLLFGLGPAVMEEVLFRGVLLRLFDHWFGSWIAVAAVSVLFALVHSMSSPAGPVAAVFVLLSSSLLLNMAYLLTRRLWLPIALHFAFNATQAAVFGLSVTGSNAGAGLITPSLQGPDLLSGGALGGEGSIVIVLIALAAGVVLTVVAVRRGCLRPRAARG